MNRRTTALLTAWLAHACTPCPPCTAETVRVEHGGAEVIASPTGDDVSLMLVDVVTPRLCDALRGSFVGLPGEGGSSGPASGNDPTVGRWWIRECTAELDGDRLALRIEGTGWTWVDRESLGFQVRQYLRFDAQASFRARMDMGYDREHHVATLWMRPDPGVDARVEPRGLVEARATNVLSGMLGGLLELSGSSASQRAQLQVAEEGSARLRERFATGFTVTFSLDGEQMDFMVGALVRGQVPMRPYAPERGVVWLVNQRARLWPGGLDVVGPIAPGRGPMALDLELEEGEGLNVDAVCQSDFERFYDWTLQGASPAAPNGTRVLESTRVGHADRAILPTVDCPQILLLTGRNGATLPSQARLRIVPESAPTRTALAAQSATATSPEAAAHGARGPLRLQIAGFSVAPLSAAGGRWDLVGSEPDPYVIVVSLPGQREVARTEPTTDSHERTLDQWLPGALRAEDFPLRISVFDEDVGSDEMIGAGDLTLAALSGSSGEAHVELRSQEQVPRPMGTVRIRYAETH